MDWYMPPVGHRDPLTAARARHQQDADAAYSQWANSPAGRNYMYRTFNGKGIRTADIHRLAREHWDSNVSAMGPFDEFDYEVSPGQAGGFTATRLPPGVKRPAPPPPPPEPQYVPRPQRPWGDPRFPHGMPDPDTSGRPVGGNVGIPGARPAPSGPGGRRPTLGTPAGVQDTPFTAAYTADTSAQVPRGHMSDSRVGVVQAGSTRPGGLPSSRSPAPPARDKSPSRTISPGRAYSRY